MKIEVNEILSSDVKVVVKTVEKRKLVITFDDPLFPGETVKFSKVFTIRNGKPPYIDVYFFLEERYIERIGGGWKCLNTTDKGHVGPNWMPISPKAQNARRKLVVKRNNAVLARAREVSRAIAGQLK